jgi:hypothetical protein
VPNKVDILSFIKVLGAAATFEDLAQSERDYLSAFHCVIDNVAVGRDLPEGFRSRLHESLNEFRGEPEFSELHVRNEAAFLLRSGGSWNLGAGVALIESVSIC